MNRNRQLDGLRGIASIIVLCVHGIIAFNFAIFTGQTKHSIFSWDIYYSGAPFLLPLAGNFGVCLFFVLSGYVLSISLSNSNLGLIALIFKRYTRFTIPILAACLTSYALLASGFIYNQEFALISKSTWLADQMQQNPILSEAIYEGLIGALWTANPTKTTYSAVLWTMPIEFRGSIIMAVIFIATSFRTACDIKIKKRRIYIFIVLSLLGFNSYLGLFAIGALIQLTQINLRINSRLGQILFFAGIFLGTIPYSVARWNIFNVFLGERSPLPISWVPYSFSLIELYHALGAVLLLIAANSWIPFRKILANKMFVFVGEISFPLYLLHLPILMSIVCFLSLTMIDGGMPYTWTMILGFILYLISIFLAASLFLIMFERPSIILSDKISHAIETLKVRAYSFILKVKISYIASKS